MNQKAEERGQGVTTVIDDLFARLRVLKKERVKTEQSTKRGRVTEITAKGQKSLGLLEFAHLPRIGEHVVFDSADLPDRPGQNGGAVFEVVRVAHRACLVESNQHMADACDLWVVYRNSEVEIIKELKRKWDTLGG